MKPDLTLMDKAKLAKEKRAFAQRIAKRLRTICKSRKMTQEMLAYKAGYSRNVIGNFEQAINSPTAYTVWRLAHALDVDVCELVKDLWYRDI